MSEIVEFISAGDGTERWLVYAKNSTFVVGTVEWSERKKAFDYLPNANANLMKLLADPAARQEIQQFCKERTEERIEQGGNR